ncbi:MAG: HAD family phosphatase, partial [Pseudomonadota bacterium]
MNVVFDIGGVLLDWSPQRLLAQHGADDALAEALFRHKRWYQLDAGTATRAEYEAEVVAALDLERPWLSGLLDAMP